MLSQALKAYREKYAVTQETLANDLSVDVRTIRRWENQETILKDVEELKRIASKLGVEAEHLGVMSEIIDDSVSLETLERVWLLVNNGRAWEARSIADHLVHDVNTRALQTGKEEDIYRLVQAQYAASYTKAMNTRLSEIQLPLESYHSMAENARLLKDPMWLSLALTYEGDMYNRVNQLQTGIPLLQDAIEIMGDNDRAARGNALQLLARAYFKAGNFKEFEHTLKLAEEMAGLLSDREETRGQYGLISIYEEYAKSYALSGDMQKSLDYLDKAYGLGNIDTHWKIVLETTKVTALVRGGEIEQGTDLGLWCIEECRKHGTIRLLERIYGAQRYLQQLKNQIGRSDDRLREALDGPAEY